jgi:hypothetical protein
MAGRPSKACRQARLVPQGGSIWYLIVLITSSKRGHRSSTLVRKCFIMCGLRRKTMGPLWGHIGACFGVSVKMGGVILPRKVTKVAKAHPSSPALSGIRPAGAARTSQRDVPTTGAKGLRPGWFGPAGREHLALIRAHTCSKRGNTSSTNFHKNLIIRHLSGVYNGHRWGKVGARSGTK